MSYLCITNYSSRTFRDDYQFSHAHFIFSGSKFHLMSEMFSSPKSSIEALQAKDLIYRDSDGFIVYDRLMSLWLKRQLL